MALDWLNVIRPDIAVVSAGRRNPYGHPAEDVLTAYRAVGAQIWRTDEDGAVWVDLDIKQSRVTVHSTRDWEFQPAIQSSAPWTVEWDNFRRIWYRWNWI